MDNQGGTAMIRPMDFLIHGLFFPKKPYEERKHKNEDYIKRWIRKGIRRKHVSH